MGNNIERYIINYRFYLLTNLCRSIATATAVCVLTLPVQNNKSIKGLFTHDVWKYTVLGVSLMQIQHSALLRAVFATPPHPSYCIFRTSLATVL